MTAKELRALCDKPENYDMWGNLHEGYTDEELESELKKLGSLDHLIEIWTSVMDVRRDQMAEADYQIKMATGYSPYGYHKD